MWWQAFLRLWFRCWWCWCFGGSLNISRDGNSFRLKKWYQWGSFDQAFTSCYNIDTIMVKMGWIAVNWSQGRKSILLYESSSRSSLSILPKIQLFCYSEEGWRYECSRRCPNFVFCGGLGHLSWLWQHTAFLLRCSSMGHSGWEELVVLALFLPHSLFLLQAILMHSPGNHCFRGDQQGTQLKNSQWLA